MSEVRGGKKRRYIKDNLYFEIQKGLEFFGWFDLDSSRTLQIIPAALDPDEEIIPNVVSISAEDFSDENIELGSELAESSWDIYIDVYAENEDIGIEITFDIVDTLRGKVPEIGRTSRVLDVYNPEVDADEYLFSCDITHIEVGRSRETSKPHLRYYWIILCTLEEVS